ncbi:hybrid sensor histidine kinase/response regulator [Aliishimia ponticola]|uniref:histidine kinase n=1 Tax=Aliishimia ponticola TaxID=2499833 RepID=A0A4S4NCB1_9RHOB|nr:HWE histidine kinase domain-containing protein [Aliishimia ponticola]THH37066.1 hybrid sensor histidine kinase/response regulator [Aliishimia ponticola]
MCSEATAHRRDLFDDTSSRQIFGASSQSYATVFVLSSDWTVLGVSDNTFDTIKAEPESLLGQDFSDLLDSDSMHDLRSQVQVLTIDMPVLYLRNCTLLGRSERMDATVTLSGGRLAVEFEPAAEAFEPARDAIQLQRLFLRIAARGALPEVLQEAARTIRALTGFDRVSVHRILPLGFGPALACVASAPLQTEPDEAVLRAYGVQFSPNLHVLADAAQHSARSVVTQSVPDALKPFDARALSSAASGPHLCEALQRGGVAAATSVPIRVRGELWGVILCHHIHPHAPPVNQRSDLSAFAFLLGMEIERSGQVGGTELRTRLRTVRKQLLEQMDETKALGPAVLASVADIKAALPHDGLAIWADGAYLGTGSALPKVDFEAAFERLSTVDEDEIVIADTLGDIGLRSKIMRSDRTSLLAIPIGTAARAMVILTRSHSGAEQVASAWRPWEIEAARGLQAALTGARMKAIEATGVSGKLAQERQGLLIAELNHRVRNNLSLIQGLVTQTKRSACTVERYAQVLENRIQALVQAYNDLTEKGWAWLGAQEMLDRAVIAVPGSAADTTEVIGQDFKLSPSAYAVMSLVLHELRSNAVKFGALSRPSGSVTISTSMAEDGFGEIIWTEAGGPSVAYPIKRGFGCQVIEGAVRHELRGTSELMFEAGGIIARFRLPPEHVRRTRDVQTPRDRSGAGQDTSGLRPVIQIDGVALNLEDNLVISMESDHLLRAAGATSVRTCNSVDAAFEALDSGEITFALLDINLGGETSLAVAEQIWNDGIPAALATGYGGDEDLLAEYPPLPVLTKPFTLADIRQALRVFRDND